MKIYLILVLFFTITLNTFCQTTAQPAVCHSWADQKNNFFDIIGYDFEMFLSDALKDFDIDTVNCSKVTYDEFFDKYSGQDGLSKYRYVFVSIKKQNGVVTRSDYQNFTGSLKGVKTKIVIFHNKSKTTDYESLSIYSID